uniref:Granulin a n=1 Tax=Cyclopterus lumpus TaxID=8103 RepID=A0A8C2YVJ5_CYCLU
VHAVKCFCCAVAELVSTILCSDGVSECPDESTCCETPVGTWACCPMLKVQRGTNVPCDGTAVCADNTTCCKNAAGGWSCCPLPEAVCCVDLVHCCPKGKRCNLVVQTCDDDRYSVGNVTCDSTHFCPDGSTCCRTLTKDWACCGLPQVNTQPLLPDRHHLRPGHDHLWRALGLHAHGAEDARVFHGGTDDGGRSDPKSGGTEGGKESPGDL